MLLALIPALVGCGLPIGETRYAPANSGADPFASVRAKAEQFYQAGLADERSGDWNKALDDFRQASMWDHDGRQDIADALGRAQAQVDWQTIRSVGPASSTPTPAASTQKPAATDTARTPTQPSVSRGDAGTSQRSRFDSQRFPYSVDIPLGWVEQAGGTGQAPADTFLAKPGTNSGALVMIKAEPAGFSTTLDELYTATERALRAGGIKNVGINSRRQVADQPAYVMGYVDGTGAGTVSVRHAIFVTPDRAWHVILLATPSMTADLDRIFNDMLDSFEFKSSAFPVQ